MASETKIVNKETGGAKAAKPERYDLLPWPELAELARLYAAGANKYEDRNWEKGYDLSLSFSALMRHLTLFWAGEDYDDETKCHHLASVMFHCAAMMRFTNGTFPESLDNRP